MHMRNPRDFGAGRPCPGRRVALAALFAVLLVLLAGIPVKADFTKATVTSIIYNPTKPQPGTSFTLSVTIQNTFNQDIRVKWFGVHYDWMPTNTYVYQDFSSSPMVIVPFSSWTFTMNVAIPANTTYSLHPYNFKMGFESQGYSYTETTVDYNDFFINKYVPPEQIPIWKQPIFMVVIVIILVVVMVIAVLVVLRKRKADREKSKTRMEFKTTGPAQSQEEVELARTVTKGFGPGAGGSVRMDNQARHWEAKQDQRYVGQPPKPPIYKVLGTTDGQQPQAQPPGPPQALPPPSSGSPQPMPAAPPPRMMPQTPPSTPGTPPPLPPPIPKEQGTLHQCPMCGKMNKASDTVCPKCGNKY